MLCVHPQGGLSIQTWYNEAVRRPLCVPVACVALLPLMKGWCRMLHACEALLVVCWLYGQALTVLPSHSTAQLQGCCISQGVLLRLLMHACIHECTC